MKALVYHGPGTKSLGERPMPELAASTDAIVRVIRTTICGTDLHILKGDVPTCGPGRILGHDLQPRCRFPCAKGHHRGVRVTNIQNVDPGSRQAGTSSHLDLLPRFMLD